LALAYEQGDWEEIFRLCAALGLDVSQLPDYYLEALRWSQMLMEDTA